MAEGEAPVFEDDGNTVDITVEGDFEGIQLVKSKINAIVVDKVCFIFKYSQ